MESELERFHKQNTELELNITELKQKLKATDKEMHGERQRVRRTRRREERGAGGVVLLTATCHWLVLHNRGYQTRRQVEFSFESFTFQVRVKALVIYEISS